MPPTPKTPSSQVSQPGQPSQITSFQLKFSYWYVIHKFQLRKILIVFLIVLNLGFYGYAIYRAVVILIIQNQTYQQDLNSLSANLVDYSYFREANKPQGLEILSFDSLGGRDDRYDFVAQISNQNSDWVAADVLLQLIVNNQVVAEKRSFILPNEDKYLGFFGQEMTGLSDPTISVAEVKWQRFHRFDEFKEPRLNFTLADMEFKSAQESGIRGDLPVSTLNFKITNNTGFNYWRVGIYMVLLSGPQVVGANFTSLDQFLSRETRNIEMRFYESLPEVTDIKILPEVNILDPAVYMPVK